MVCLKTAFILAVLTFTVKASAEENATKILAHCSLTNVTVKYTPEANIAGKFYFENTTDPECQKEFSSGAEEMLVADYKTCVPDGSKNFTIIVEYVNEANETKKSRGSGSCELKPVETLKFSRGLLVKGVPAAENQTDVEESDIEIEMIPIEVTSESTLQGDLKLLGTEDKEVEEVSGGEKIKLEIEVSGNPEVLAAYKKMFVESCVITSATNVSDKVEINYGCNPTDPEIPQWTQNGNKFTSEYTAKQLGEDNSITIDCSIKACIDEETCPKPECPGEASETKPSDAEAGNAEASETKPSDTEASDAKASDAEASDAKASDAEASARRRRDVIGGLFAGPNMDDFKFETINVNSPPLTIFVMFLTH